MMKGSRKHNAPLSNAAPAAHSPGPVAWSRWRLLAQHPVSPCSEHHNSPKPSLGQERPKGSGDKGPMAKAEKSPARNHEGGNTSLQVQGHPQVTPLQLCQGTPTGREAVTHHGETWQPPRALLGARGSCTTRTHGSQDHPFNQDWRKLER